MSGGCCCVILVLVTKDPRFWLEHERRCCSEQGCARPLPAQPKPQHHSLTGQKYTGGDILGTKLKQSKCRTLNSLSKENGSLILTARYLILRSCSRTCFEQRLESLSRRVAAPPELKPCTPRGWVSTAWSLQPFRDSSPAPLLILCLCSVSSPKPGA